MSDEEQAATYVRDVRRDGSIWGWLLFDKRKPPLPISLDVWREVAELAVQREADERE